MAITAVPPLPSSADCRRVEHSRLRRRLLYSEFEADLRDRITKAIGNVRSDAWGYPDLTANPYLSVWSQVAVLYNAEPIVLATPASAELVERVGDAGFWPLMQRVQRDTLALREMLVRPHVERATGAITFRPVFPDMVTARATARNPGMPVLLRELAPEAAVEEWCYHELSIEDPQAPYYRVFTEQGRDVTEAVLGDRYDGVDYPFRRTQGERAGEPILPYAWYHAAETSFLFDPFTLREVVEGSLNIGVLLTFYQHIVRNAAWKQRFTLNAEPIGAEPEGGDLATRREVVADPATAVNFRSTDGAPSAQIGQWEEPTDPEAVLRSISMYERRILLLAGVQPPDVTRQEADVRSGYSLAVSRESIREQQRIYTPQFRKADQQMLALCACLSNRELGTSHSENPAEYRMVYEGVPESPEETQARLKELEAKRTAGLIGPISAYQAMNPQTDPEEALAALVQIQTETGRVEEAVAGVIGKAAVPPVVDLDVGKVQAAQSIVLAAAKGEMSAATAKAMLIGVIGLTADAAETIASTLAKPASPPQEGMAA